MERIGIEYLANAFWQLPLLALGAWTLLRIWRPGPAAQHRVWLLVLALALLLPLRGIAPALRQPVGPSPAAAFGSASPVVLSPALDASAAVNHAEGILADKSINASESWWSFATAPQPVHLNAAAIDWILGLWLATALFGLFRLLLAWMAARRLARSSREAVLAGRETAALLECANRMRIKMPRVHESGHISGPVVVGAARPILLWPKHFARRSDAELEAALCHEMAHVRRHDYAVNLLCEAASLPLKWHPAIYGVERRIRVTREMACDAMAAQAMNSETAYASCLVSLARSIAGGTVERSLAAGLFNGNAMEERVMRLVQVGKAASGRVRIARASAGAAAMIAAIALAAAFHVVPAMAQTAPPPVPPPAQAAPPAPPSHIAPATPAPVTAPSVPPIPLKPVAQTPQVPPVPPPAVARPALVKPGHVHHARNEDRPIIICDSRDLTPAERARLERQLEEAQRKIAAATAKIDSPEFRKQIEEAQRKALQAETMLNSAQFKQRMAEAQKQIDEATAKMNSPENRAKIQAEIDAVSKKSSAEAQKRLQEMMAKMNSPENTAKIQAEIDAVSKKSSAEAQKRLQEMMAKMNSPENTAKIQAEIDALAKANSAEVQRQMADAQKQIAEATAQINSPAFRRQIEDAAKAASAVNSAEIQKQMADAQKQIADALAQVKAQQKTAAPK